MTEFFKGRYHCTGCGCFVSHQDLNDGYADYNDDEPTFASGNLTNWKPIITCRVCSGYDLDHGIDCNCCPLGYAITG